MSSIHSMLEQLRAKSGSALKETLRGFLTFNGHEGDCFRRYVMAVLDPAVTYGHAGKLPPVKVQLPLVAQWGDDCHFLLDRMARRELTGNALKAALQEFVDTHDAFAADLLSRALKKDLKCGVDVKTINSLELPEFRIPVFTCQLAKEFEAKRMAEGRWAACIKFDGMRALGLVRDTQVNFFTRSGNPIKALDQLAPQVLSVFGGQEVVIDCEGVSTSFLDTVSELRRKNPDTVGDDVVLQVFDMVPYAAFRDAVGRQPVGDVLEERLALLAMTMAGAEPQPALSLVDHIPVDTPEEVHALNEKWIEMGLEGAIAKRLDARYTKDRTFDWLKLKETEDTTCEILSVYEGEADGQFAGMLGGVNVAVDGVPSRVGGGWTPYERAAIWAAHTGIAIALPTITNENGLRVVTTTLVQPDPSNQVIGRLIDVRFNGKMPSGALRHARKTRFRDLTSAPGQIA